VPFNQLPNRSIAWWVNTNGQTPADVIHLLIYGPAALILFAIIFPRSASTIFMVPIIGAIAVGWAAGCRPAARDLVNSGLTLALVAFAAWAMVSAVWSFSPKATLNKPPYLFAAVVGVGWVLWLMRSAPADVLAALGRGVLLGTICGGLLVSFEIVTQQALMRFAQNLGGPYPDEIDKHYEVRNGIVVFVSDANLKRRITIVSLLLLPSAVFAVGLAKSRTRLVGCGALLAIATAVLLRGSHQSAQVALTAGLAVYGLAALALSWTRLAVGVAWTAAALLVVPAVLWLHSTGVHKDPAKLFYSARHRIVIWDYTAKQWQLAPVLGIGADATAAHTASVENARLAKGEARVWDAEFEVSTASHAHNAFLQMWYELGAIGAAIFALIGVAAIAAIRHTRPAVQPLMLAQFAAVSGMIGFSFSIWQLWFQGAIGLAALAMLLAVNSRNT
jgi:hypothetical protein